MPLSKIVRLSTSNLKPFCTVTNWFFRMTFFWETWEISSNDKATLVLLVMCSQLCLFISAHAKKHNGIVEGHTNDLFQSNGRSTGQKIHMNNRHVV